MTDLCLADLGGPRRDELVVDSDLDAWALFADTPGAELTAKVAAYRRLTPITATKAAPAKGRAWWLADILRSAGLSVVEVDGWQTRGKPGLDPDYQLVHHTAGPARGNAPSLRICTVGRTDLPGPLCNVLAARDGTLYVVASGIANHAGRGDWPGAGELVEGGNDDSIGWECENTGIGQPWPEVQLDAMARGMAAMCRHLGTSADSVTFHRIFARPKGRKPDPTGLDIAPWQARVTTHLEEDDMPLNEADFERIRAEVTAAVLDVLHTEGVSEGVADIRSQVGADDSPVPYNLRVFAGEVLDADAKRRLKRVGG